MKNSGRVLSIIIMIMLFITSYITPYAHAYTGEINKEPGELSFNTEQEKAVNQMLLDSHNLSIISNQPKESQSVTNKVYQKATFPPKQKEQKEILIKYKDLKKSESAKSKLKYRLNLTKLNSKKKIESLKIELVEIGDNDEINKVLDELNNDPSVQYAQPNYKISLSSVPSDQYFSEQWALQNVGQVVYGQAGTAGIDINAVSAWDIATGNTGIIVGLPDTDIDISHNDIADNIYTNPEEIPANGIDDDGNGYIDDVNGWDFFSNDNSVFDSQIDDLHGTQLAGIIAAGMNNGGIAGAAPGVKILPLKFINGDYGYTSDVIEAIAYAEASGVKIMNCSWGGTGENLALQDAMQNSDMLFVR